MIFQFPDYDTLKLALTSGVVPATVSVAPVTAGVDAAGRPWLDAAVDKKLAAQLAKLGVTRTDTPPSAGEELGNWLQALPLVRDPKSVESPGGEVIFELSDATRLPELVGEMLRLNVDRQSFRWLDSGGVLLRVVGPPYYTLLRAIDRDAPGAVRAYVERAPRVWVEIGYSHPLVASITPPDDQVLFLRSPREWKRVDEAPFRDIYEILDFKLPHAKLDWTAAELRKKLIVPLRLVDGDRHDPELWVLRDDPVNRLDALVRDAREALIQRLMFAVGEHDGKPIIVLRVRPSKQPPPQLVIEAEAYASFLRLDNLFVPVGTRIHPVLRRDAVRRMLADDPAQINWLRPDPARRGTFIPECVPDDAFRPLQDWVDYVLDHDREALTHWVEEFKFDFDPFVCPEEEASPRVRPAKRRPIATARDEGEPRAVHSAKPTPAAKPAEPAVPVAVEYEELVVAPPSKLQVELASLQDRFLALEGGLDDPARLRLWPEMALRHAALKHAADAGLCWMNLLWELLDLDAEVADLKKEQTDERRTARQARLAELRKLVALLGGEAELAKHWVWTEGVLPELNLTAGDLDRLLGNEQPSFGEVRGLIACLVWSSYNAAASKAILSRLPNIQQHLERHERAVGLRPVWLGWHALTKLSGDTLGLARVRDRLIYRLVTEGYSAERDLPNFLRAAGHQDRERVQAVQAHVDRIRELALAWCAESKLSEGRSGSVKHTSGHFVDLLFAFGHARLGQPTRARELLKAAESAVADLRKAAKGDSQVAAVHQFLVKAFRYRIEQALQGRPHAGPLAEELRDELDRTIGRAEGLNNPRYFIDRMRQQSHVLEPDESFDPYRDYHMKAVPELERRLAALQNIRDRRELQATVLDLLKSGAGRPPTVDERLLILGESLMLAPRSGESLAIGLLAEVEPALDARPGERDGVDPAKLPGLHAALLDRALLMAANYDRVDLVQRLWPRFVRLLETLHSKTLPTDTNHLFAACLRSMRKLGLRDDIARLIDQADVRVRKGRSVTALQREAGPEWPATLSTLLHLAAGWLFFGHVEKATEVLNAARELLLTNTEAGNSGGLYPRQYAGLVVAYVNALGQAPVEVALRGIEEIFKKMRRLTDTFTTAPYYAWLHLNIIEAVVLAVVSEEFALGPSARRWMDDDEYLIRRRIHRDHRVMVGKG